MSGLLCASSISPDFKTQSALGFHRGFSFLDGNGPIFVLDDLSDKQWKYTMVFCNRCFTGRDNYPLYRPKNPEKIY